METYLETQRFSENFFYRQDSSQNNLEFESKVLQMEIMQNDGIRHQRTFQNRSVTDQIETVESDSYASTYDNGTNENINQELSRRVRELDKVEKEVKLPTKKPEILTKDRINLLRTYLGIEYKDHQEEDAAQCSLEC